jgi:hypothetical protein
MVVGPIRGVTGYARATGIKAQKSCFVRLARAGAEALGTPWTGFGERYVMFGPRSTFSVSIGRCAGVPEGS